MSEFTPSRRAVVRTAAWTVPAVSIAAAAPAFAVSPPTDPAPGPAPDLSGTAISTPNRNGSTISFAPFDIVNSGAVDTAGVTVTFTLASGQITEILGQYGAIPVQMAVDGFGGNNGNEISVSTRPSNEVTVTFPADFWDDNGNAHANNGVPLSTTVTLFLQTDHDGANTVDVDITAANTPSGASATGSYSV